MVEVLQGYGLKLNESNVCRIIRFIRVNDLIVGLKGSSAGYYIISSEQEFMGYEDTLLSREVALRKVRMSMKRQRRAMFSQVAQKQVHLF